jgi:hypothetical protein
MSWEGRGFLAFSALVARCLRFSCCFTIFVLALDDADAPSLLDLPAIASCTNNHYSVSNIYSYFNWEDRYLQVA